MITDLITKAQKNQMIYLPCKLPLGVNSENNKLVFTYTDENTVIPITYELLLTRDAMTHLVQHLRITGKDRHTVKSLYQTNLAEFVNVINQFRAKQERTDLWRKGQTYILATYNGYVYGILANYNPKLHAEVLQDIEESGLGNAVARCYVTPKEMHVYLSYHVKDGFEVGLDVRNGETGFVALSYNLYVYQKKGDYTFATPSYGRRKHLSNLELVDDDLNDLYAELQEIKFHEYILNAESKEYAKMILDDKKFEKIHDLVTPYDSRLKKLYSLLGLLAAKRNERGYKTLCAQALDMLYSHIVEQI